MDSGILFRGARVDAEGPLVDLLVRDGRIVSAAAGEGVPSTEDSPSPESTPSQEGLRLIELDGRVVLPGFIESHIHLDKAFLEERRPNLSGTLQDVIAITLELKKSVTNKDIRERSERTLRLLVRHGATRLRAQVEVDPIVGLKGMEATLELREACAGIADIQIVVFPQEGIEQQPGTEELMREAMRMGGDAVGGIPYNDTDPERHLDIVFGLAAEFGCGIDLHIDFSDDPGECVIESVARRTGASGLEGKVVVAHLTSLGAMDGERAARVIGAIAKAEITVILLPATDLFLNGRGGDPPPASGGSPGCANSSPPG